MGHKIVIGPIDKGLRTDRTAFVIDNDSFPTLINAYQWRGRVKRKRGTSLLTRLQRFFSSTISSYNSGSTKITFDGSGNANLLTGFTTLEPNASIVEGSVTIIGSIGPTTFTDPTMDGFLTPTGTGGPNTINYATGAILIPAQAGGTATATFTYFPTLPVLGLEGLTLTATQFPGMLAFDKTYSYNIPTTSPYTAYSVSFYKNPAADPVNLPGYTPKTPPTQNISPTTWNGQDYQQFWSTNYQGAIWVTNGINVPFTGTTIGMQFKTVFTGMGGGINQTSATTALFAVLGHNLQVGDFIFVNETTNIIGLNFQTGYVTLVNNANQFTATFPFATLNPGKDNNGIVQYLTSQANPAIDCLRWYDGDPTATGGTTFAQGLGWVNFAPPLSLNAYSISDAPQKQYYLVGARMILPYKDRLLFFGAVIQTSTGNPIYLQDTVIYSQNGTPYYTASFTLPVGAKDPTFPNITFNPILVPANQTATAPAYFEDIQGAFGGFVSSGLDQEILTASLKEDAVIVGHTVTQTRLVYTGNDIIPFNFFIVNSELGSGSTFSIINMDQGVITKGSRGYVITSQVGAQRIDLEIPDQVFEVNLTLNGNERFTAQRDFINEWVYLSYPSNSVAYKFNNQTLQYNYRDNSWAIFNESYTTYGQFYKQTGFTWATVGQTYPTWSQWNVPWNAGISTLEQPIVIAGNQQGFVMVREGGTSEGISLSIKNLVGSVITSPDHTLNPGDYIIIQGVLGDLGDQVNDQIFSVGGNVTSTSFTLLPNISGGTYTGGGVIKRMYVPFIQTKQFPVAWDMARKTRLGPQQYLFTTTPNAQIQLLIFLSQNTASAYNDPLNHIVPDPLSVNNSLIYSTILYTCPESTNLGLTPASSNMANPANTNLQMIVQPTGVSQQEQIWHRMNTSLIGDTIQIAFTMSDAQMRAEQSTTSIFVITGATQADPCVLTCKNTLGSGQLVLINNVVGMTQLNGNTFFVVSATPTTLTIGVNATAFTGYISGGTATLIDFPNQFAEIEFHSAILDVNPSQVLA